MPTAVKLIDSNCFQYNCTYKRLKWWNRSETRTSITGMNRKKGISLLVVKMAQCVTTYMNRGPAVCHIYGVRHLSANFRGRCDYLNMALTICSIRINGIALSGVYFVGFPANSSKCEQSVRIHFTFFLLWAGSIWLLNTICTRTLSRNVFFYVSN